MRNQQPQQPFQDTRKAVNILYGLAYAHALCIWPFIRHTFGIWAFGMSGVIGFAIIIIYLSATQSPAMLWFFWAWLFLVAWHRARAMRRERKGLVIHSQYTGRPWLALKVPFIRDELRAKRFEPVLCLVAGGLLSALDQGLGGFVLIGAFSTAITTGVGFEVNRVRVRRMQDAYLESQYVAGQVRDGM